MFSVEEINDPGSTCVADRCECCDREGFFAAMSADATLSDDGNEQNPTQWADQEIFNAGGRMDAVISQTDDGRSLIADYRNDLYGQMRTAWNFEVADGKVTRIEAGQA